MPELTQPSSVAGAATPAGSASEDCPLKALENRAEKEKAEMQAKEEAAKQRIAEERELLQQLEEETKQRIEAERREMQARESETKRRIDEERANAKKTVTNHFTQQNSNSCVIASSRNMIYQLTGNDISEKSLQDEMKVIINDHDHNFETTGVNPVHAETLLKKHGITTQSQYNVSSTDLVDLVKDKPALIGFKNPGHRVLLDSVSTDKDGNRVYNVKDPDPAYNGITRRMSQADFDAKYNPNAIVISGTAQ